MMEGVVNISEKFKYFIWLPPKTGTRHASFIFQHYDVKTIEFKQGQPNRITDFNHNHNQNFFLNHEKYDFIITARNPFSRYISYFNFNNRENHQEINVDNFRSFFYNKIESQEVLRFFSFLNERTPNFFLRIEHLWKDYSKIPFVRNSRLYKSGILYELCNKKMYENRINMNFKDFYSTDMKDYMFKIGKKYFELCEYEYPY